MNTKLLTAVALVAFLATPALAMPTQFVDTIPQLSSGLVQVKQNRGGDGQRGGDRSRSDDSRSSPSNSASGSGRSKPRIPGGSGCDDAGDAAEHSACGGTVVQPAKVKKSKAAGTVSGRKKPRVKGGSGCDDAGDIAEHAECR